MAISINKKTGKKTKAITLTMPRKPKEGDVIVGIGRKGKIVWKVFIS